jgi:hypothetical protein
MLPIQIKVWVVPQYKYGSRGKALFKPNLLSDDELCPELGIYSASKIEMRNNLKNKAQENALKNTLHILTTRYFRAERSRTTTVFLLHPGKRYIIMMAIVAGIVLSLICYSLFLRPGDDTKRLDNKYYNTHFGHLSRTMGTQEAEAWLKKL